MSKMKMLLPAILLAFGLSKTLLSAESGPIEISYLKNRLLCDDRRYGSFAYVLQLLSERNAKVLVETGTARFGNACFRGDGGSTIIFAEWAMDHQGMLFSVDINEGAVEKARSAVIDYVPHVEVVCNDSLIFLREFAQSIDFLYLDSYDYDLNDPEPSKIHHLNEIVLAYPKLHDRSIVMIDDCNLPGGGKGGYVIEYLTERGWQVAYNRHQVILLKPPIKVILY